MSHRAIPGSFRDPSGSLFVKNGTIYRSIQHTYKTHYDHLMSSGLYQALATDGLLVLHNEVVLEGTPYRDSYKIIEPELIPFISYPYEWCFGELKDAALTTLAIQKKALGFGMSLKDASAYNVQFRGGRPVWIDTLSFEMYQERHPWVAYRQFCEHFLAPLALASFKDVRLNQLLQAFIGGIPLDLASALLPLRTYLIPSLFSHIHLHAKSQIRFADKAVDTRRLNINRFAMRGLVDSLASAVQQLRWEPRGTKWADYRADISYSSQALRHKEELVREFLGMLKPKTVWDIGANTGTMSRIATEAGAQVVSLDSDPGAVEKNYRVCKKDAATNVLPLLIDITNPSPAIGWENRERMSLLKRGSADTALALALIHHLALTHNVPLDRLSRFFAKICSSLIVEFVPKRDPGVQKLLASREDIFPHYTRQSFEAAFSRYFDVHRTEKIKTSERVMYCMQKI